MQAQPCGLTGVGAVAPGVHVFLHIAYPPSGWPAGESFVNAAGRRLQAGDVPADGHASIRVGTTRDNLPEALVDDRRAVAKLASAALIEAITTFIEAEDASLTGAQLACLYRALGAAVDLPKTGVLPDGAPAE